jgi:hypothetical protein
MQPLVWKDIGAHEFNRSGEGWQDRGKSWRVHCPIDYKRKGLIRELRDDYPLSSRVNPRLVAENIRPAAGLRSTKTGGFRYAGSNRISDFSLAALQRRLGAGTKLRAGHRSGRQPAEHARQGYADWIGARHVEDAR